MIKPLALSLGVLSILFGLDAQPRNDAFLFCLNSDISPLNITRVDSGDFVDNDEINRFLQEKGIVSIEKWIPGATDMDRDGDIYLNRMWPWNIVQYCQKKITMFLTLTL